MPLATAIRESLTHADALEYACALGGFTATWKATNGALHVASITRPSSALSSRSQAGIAGAAAALSLAFLPRSTRIAFGVQMMLRAAQSLYTYHKARGRVDWPHGDSLMFAWACGQIMYAFALRQESIPWSFYQWMLRESNVDPKSVEFNKDIVRSGGLTVPGDVAEVCKAIGGGQAVTELCLEVVGSRVAAGEPVCMPCAMIHARTTHCVRYFLWLAVRVVRRMFPVNLALNLVPAIVLKLNHFLKKYGWV